jgi:hypothetical protein
MKTNHTQHSFYEKGVSYMDIVNQQHVDPDEQEKKADEGGGVGGMDNG